MERALTPTLAAALGELRELMNIMDWRQSPLAGPFTQAAILLLAAELVAERGYSESEAVDAAAIRCGVSPETARSRAKRWPRDSRALCTQLSSGAGVLLIEDQRVLPLEKSNGHH
jgi:hypothetical protein